MEGRRRKMCIGGKKEGDVIGGKKEEDVYWREEGEMCI